MKPSMVEDMDVAAEARSAGRFTADPRQSFTMPSALYLDPAVLEAEREAIFWKSWIYVCPVVDVARPGAYVTADIAGQPIMVIRADDQQLRSFYNVCQHRGHLLLEGSGTVGSRITCPYHAWAYDATGALRGARMSDRMDGFDFDEFSLPSVRLEIFHDLVFVNLDPGAAPMNDVYPGLSDELDRLRSIEGPAVARKPTVFDIDANWKNVGDNLLECYHCHPAHPDFVELIDMDTYRNECFDNWSVQAGASRAVNPVYDTSDGAQTFSSVYVWPNLSIGHLPGQRGKFLFQFTPTGPETTRQVLTYLGPDDEDTYSEQSATRWFDNVLGPEDVSLVESVQRGLRSKGYDQGRFICIPDRPEISEHAVHHFHAMVLAALGLLDDSDP